MPVVIGGDNLPSPVRIGLTDLTNIGDQKQVARGAMDPRFCRYRKENRRRKKYNQFPFPPIVGPSDAFENNLIKIILLLKILIQKPY